MRGIGGKQIACSESLQLDLTWFLQRQSWPITFVVKCEDQGVKPDEELRKYYVVSFSS
jgi:hypothetical protein